MPIDYSSESMFHAPIMRIDDTGHGFVGVVYHATDRQSVDHKTSKPKWFHNKTVVLAFDKPQGGEPVMEFVFHVAVEKGVGAFTKRDENGDPIKLSNGNNATEVHTITNQDVAIVTGSAWLSKLVKSVRLNEGHRVRIKRHTQARDEVGDRMKDVQAEIEILGTVSDPKPYDPKCAVVQSADMYGEPAMSGAGGPAPFDEEAF